MKIKYIRGDLFTTNSKLIVHGCNDRGVMGSGVAKEIRDKFPEAYKRYNAYCERHHDVGGDVIFVESNDKIIANAVTQHRYGRDGERYVNYEWVAQCGEKINKYCKENGIEYAALPKIGAGLGGGDWNVIAAIIESESKNFTPIVYVM